MKMNWGTGIVIAFICFISFIMFFVVKMNTNDKYDHDLVTEDYYAQELVHQKDIDKKKNTLKLEQPVLWKKTAEGITISFPENLIEENITGKVFLYRPSNKQLDFETTISLSNHNLLIPKKRLVDGRWNIKIDWSYQDTNYLQTEEIIY